MSTALADHEEHPRLEEAYANLRHIRDVMERSTRHSTLSGRSGLLVGLWAILGVAVTHYVVYSSAAGGDLHLHLALFAATWLAVLVLSAATDYLLTKRPAVAVGKRVFSPLGARVAQAIAPGFFAGLAFSLYLFAQHQIAHVWAFWMICYGLAGCAVGNFSVRPVSVLAWAFVLAGAVTLFLPVSWGLWMMAISFGGFHIAYGLWTGLTRGDW